MNDPLSFRSRSVLLALVALLQMGCERPTAPPSDVSPPTVALASPAGDTIVSVASLTLSGTLTDSVGVRRATYELNEGTEQELAITPGTSASFSATVTLQPGLNTLRVHAYDDAGNRGSSAPVGVTMDTLPPAVLKVISPENGKVYTDTSRTASFLVQGTVSGASRVTFHLNGGPETPLPTFVGRGCGTPCFSTIVNNLRIGTNTLVVAAYNGTGSRTVQTIVFEWHIVPQVTLSRPSGSTVVVDPENTVQVTGTALNEGGVRRVTYRVNEGPEQEVPITPGSSVALNFRVAVPLGGSRVTVNAYEASGPPGSASAEVARTLASGAPGAFASVQPGHAVTCGMSSAAGSYCWGRLPGGRDGPDLPVPTRTPGGVVFAQVYAGNEYACGLTQAGQAYCWGQNLNGVLGEGTKTSRTAPTPVVGNLRFSSLATAAFHVCGLTLEGAAYCWGSNAFGQLGNGTQTESTAPVTIPGELRFAAITAGTGYTCALTASGQAYCWGHNVAGQLGNGSIASSSVPVAVVGGHTFAAISAGGAVTCGLKADGTAFCWGNFEFVREKGVPAAVPGGFTFTSLTTGGAHACGVTVNGAGYCWGGNLSGELGTGSPSQSVPAPVSGSLRFTQIRSQGSHTCGVTQNGAAYCWGYGLNGQLGNGTHFNAPVPVRVLDPM